MPLMKVSISSPSSEGGGCLGYYSLQSDNGLKFPLVLLQAKVVGNYLMRYI